MGRLAWTWLAGVAVAGAVGACGKAYGGDEGPDPPDGSSGLDTSTPTPPADASVDGNDASVDAARCNPTAPFANQHAINELNSAGNDYGLTLSPDERMAFLGSSLAGGYLIFSATRKDRDAKFDPPSIVTSITAPAGSSVRAPSLTSDGLTIFFEVVPQGGGGHLELARRGSVTAPFADITKLTSPDPQVVDGFPSVTADGLELFYVHYTSITKEDIFVMRRSSSASEFGAGVPVTELNTPDVENGTAISADGLSLYFTRAVDADLSSAARILVAHRRDRTSPFGAPDAVPGLDPKGPYEDATWISPDGCVIYYMVGGGPAGVHFWTAKRGF